MPYYIIEESHVHMEGPKEIGEQQNSNPIATTVSVHVDYRLKAKDRTLHKYKHSYDSEFLFKLIPWLVYISNTFSPLFTAVPQNISLKEFLKISINVRQNHHNASGADFKILS